METNKLHREETVARVPLENEGLLKQFLGDIVQPPPELHIKSINYCYVISNRFEDRTIGRTKEMFEIDEKNIENTFRQLNFDVKIKRNLSLQDMKKLIGTIKLKDFSEDECLVLIILTHGDEGGKIYANDDQLLEMDWIVQQLQDIESLFGKPKLIFGNFCRGHTAMETIQFEHHDTYRSAGGFVRKAKKATMEGNFAFADATVGSFFVMALCKIMQEYFIHENVSKHHLNDVITSVNDFVSRYIKSGAVQMSEACSSLTQNIYFHPRKLH